jgi:hypothetical protein
MTLVVMGDFDTPAMLDVVRATFRDGEAREGSGKGGGAMAGSTGVQRGDRRSGVP